MLSILRKLTITLALLLVLTGCSNKTATTEVSTATDANIQSNDFYEAIQNVVSSPVVFDSDLPMPIIKDGTIYGELTINFVEKLGIWDLNNYQANQNGVRFSYAINCKVQLENYFVENKMINVVIEPKLYDYAGNEVGASGYVGWSGYNTSVELYDRTMSGNCEVVLQPVNSNTDEYRYLTLEVSDATNAVVFDTLYVDLKCLYDAPDGAQIKTVSDVSEIESINGGQYNVSFSDVYLELHSVKNDSALKQGEYKFYDFCYTVNYVRAPQNDFEVLSFDSFNNDALIEAPILEVYSDQDSTKLINDVPTAQRLLWANRNKTELYVTEFPKALYAGEQVTVSTNRLIPDSTIIQPTYIRVVLKFPSEVKSRSYEQIRDFSGRYLVYQLHLGTRTLEEEPR